MFTILVFTTKSLFVCFLLTLILPVGRFGRLTLSFTASGPIGPIDIVVNCQWADSADITCRQLRAGLLGRSWKNVKKISEYNIFVLSVVFVLSFWRHFVHDVIMHFVVSFGPVLQWLTCGYKLIQNKNKKHCLEGIRANETCREQMLTQQCIM